jgi:predicted small metal-binding protein
MKDREGVDMASGVGYNALDANRHGNPRREVAMTLQCRDTGGFCNWEGRADTEEKLVKEALRHVKEAHYMKQTAELEEHVRKSIRDE